MEYPTYEISNATIKDIINKIPKEKWHLVMRDMQAMLNQMHGTIELIKLSAEALGVDSTDLIHMGETIDWVDDGKCENEINFTGENGEVAGGVKFTEEGVEVK